MPIDAMNQHDNTNADLMAGMIQATCDFWQSMQQVMPGMESVSAQHPRIRPESCMHALMNAYSQSLQKMLSMPKLGLYRGYQERITQAVDSFIQLSVVGGEFSSRVFQPVESSLGTLLHRIREQAEGDGHGADIDAYYSQWIKVLEAEYMNMLHSPDFISSLHKLVNSCLEFSAHFEEVLQDGLQLLPVATTKDVQAVSKENQKLAKQIKAMARRLDDLEEKTGAETPA